MAKRRNWQDATVDTIDRLRRAVALDSRYNNKPLSKASLYSQSRQIVEAMGVTGARFWPVFVNTVRILVAVDAKTRISKTDLFSDADDEDDDQ